MIKEELEKEAKESWQNDGTVSGASMPGEIYVAGYLASAKPREKQIAELNNFIMQSKKDGISPVNALIIKNLGNRLIKAIKLLKFWVNDFYDGSNRPSKYEERHKALVETEQLIKETENA